MMWTIQFYTVHWCFSGISSFVFLLVFLFWTSLSSITHQTAMCLLTGFHFFLFFWLIHLHTHFVLSPLWHTTIFQLIHPQCASLLPVLHPFSLSLSPSLHQKSQTTTLTMRRRHWRALCLTWSNTINATKSTQKGRRRLTRCETLVIVVDTEGLFFDKHSFYVPWGR